MGTQYQVGKQAHELIMRHGRDEAIPGRPNGLWGRGVGQDQREPLKQAVIHDDAEPFGACATLQDFSTQRLVEWYR